MEAESAQAHSVDVAVLSKKRKEDAAATMKIRRREVSSESSAMLATRVHDVTGSTRKNGVGGTTSSSICPIMNGALLLKNRYSVLQN